MRTEIGVGIRIGIGKRRLTTKAQRHKEERKERGGEEEKIIHRGDRGGRGEENKTGGAAEGSLVGAGLRPALVCFRVGAQHPPYTTAG